MPPLPGMPDAAFWRGRRVLLTGHTGFKGSWASLWLERLGAQVAGFALAPDHTPDLFSKLAPFAGASSTTGDLADFAALSALAQDFRPQVVLHMAAQPLVRRSYRHPRETFATNVQGTANVLDAVRGLDGVEAVLAVTTDKVYAIDGGGADAEPRPFLESDRLGGHDPYSASKAAAEIVVASYAASFFQPRGVPLASARAGNVVGGGDWSEDRLIPDIWRAMHAGRTLELRYPQATRPWQHVLEPVAGYLLLLEALVERPADTPRALNFGPAPGAAEVSVAAVAEAFGRALGADRPWVQAPGEHPHETRALALDAAAAIATLGWRPRLDAAQTLEWTADWYRAHDAGGDARALTLAQIEAYEALA